MKLHIPIYLGKRNQSGLDGRYGMPCKPISVQVFRSSILKIKYLEESKELAIQITENLIIFHEHLSIPPSRKNIFLFFPARPLTKGEKTKYLKKHHLPDQEDLIYQDKEVILTKWLADDKAHIFTWTIKELIKEVQIIMPTPPNLDQVFDLDDTQPIRLEQLEFNLEDTQPISLEKLEDSR